MLIYQYSITYDKHYMCAETPVGRTLHGQRLGRRCALIETYGFASLNPVSAAIHSKIIVNFDTLQ